MADGAASGPPPRPTPRIEEAAAESAPSLDRGSRPQPRIESPRPQAMLPRTPLHELSPCRLWPRPLLWPAQLLSKAPPSRRGCCGFCAQVVVPLQRPRPRSPLRQARRSRYRGRPSQATAGPSPRSSQAVRPRPPRERASQPATRLLDTKIHGSLPQARASLRLAGASAPWQIELRPPLRKLPSLVAPTRRSTTRVTKVAA